MLFAPKAYRDSRAAAAVPVEEGIRLTRDLTALTPDVLRQHPGVLQFLRMSTCPTLARDRLVVWTWEHRIDDLNLLGIAP